MKIFHKNIFGLILVTASLLSCVSSLTASQEEFETVSSVTKAHFYHTDDDAIREHFYSGYIFPETNLLSGAAREQRADSLARICSSETRQSLEAESVESVVLAFITKKLAALVIDGVTSRLKNSLEEYTHTFSSIAYIKAGDGKEESFSLYTGVAANEQMPELAVRCFRVVKIDKDNSDPPRQRIAMDLVGLIEPVDGNPLNLRVKPLYLLYFAPEAATRTVDGVSKIGVGVSLAMDVGWREDNKVQQQEKFLDVQFLADSFSLEELRREGVIVRNYLQNPDDKASGKLVLMPPSSKTNNNIFGKNAVKPTISVIESGVEPRFIRQLYDYLGENGDDLESKLTEKLNELLDVLNTDTSGSSDGS